MKRDRKHHNSTLAVTAIALALHFCFAATASADLVIRLASEPPKVEADVDLQAAVPPPEDEIRSRGGAIDAVPAKQVEATKAEDATVKRADGEAAKVDGAKRAKVEGAKVDGNVVKAKRRKDEAAKKTEPKVEIAKQRTEPVPFLFGLFDAQKPKPAQLSDDQVKNDEVALLALQKKPPKIHDRFKKVAVPFSGYQPGTIVIDTKEKFLYFVQSPVAAIRYGIAVGREGLQFTGKVEVGAKQVWPRWIPTKEMIARDPKQYARYAEGMDGGPENPLGARAIYLHQGRQDTYLRIHGTNQPNTIGSEASNGCFRMLNADVIDLYDKVKVGAKVVVI